MRRRTFALLVVVSLAVLALLGAGVAVLAYLSGTTDDEALAQLHDLHSYSVRPGDGWVEEGPRVERHDGRGWCLLGPECGSVVLETTWVAGPGSEPLSCPALASVVREVDLVPTETGDGACRAEGVQPNGSGDVDPVRWTLTLADGVLHVELGGPVIVS